MQGTCGLHVTVRSLQSQLKESTSKVAEQEDMLREARKTCKELEQQKKNLSNRLKEVEVCKCPGTDDVHIN